MIATLEAALKPTRSRPRAERSALEIDLHRIERAIEQILLAIGEDPSRDGLRDTPRRVARAYREMFRGLTEDPATHLGRVFKQEHDGIIVLRDIPFFSVCEHHLLPFSGKVAIAYQPASGHVVGLSKLARTVDVFARRPQVQERLTDQIADALVDHLQPRGVAVIVEAEHMCMKMRGVSKCGSVMSTSAFRGVFRSDRDARADAMELMRSK